ncbi:MAG: hypothetical protein R6U32_02925 [Candidatus Woesearchaeota archaeon]
MAGPKADFAFFMGSRKDLSNFVHEVREQDIDWDTPMRGPDIYFPGRAFHRALSNGSRINDYEGKHSFFMGSGNELADFVRKEKEGMIGSDLSMGGHPRVYSPGKSFPAVGEIYDALPEVPYMVNPVDVPDKHNC